MNRLLKFQDFFSEHSSIILILDPNNGKILDANPAACKFYQYTKEEFKKLTIFDINQLPKERIGEIMNLARTKQEEHSSFPVKLKNGEIRFVEAFSTRYTMNGKEILIATINDITEKHLKETELEKEKKKFELFVKNIDGWVVFTDEAGNLFYFSDSIKNITGYSIEEFPHYSELVKNIIHLDFKEIVENDLREVHLKKSFKSCSLEVKIITKDKKEKWILHTSKPILDKEGNFLGRISNNHDITESKKLIAELKNEKEMLEYVLEASDIGIWCWNVQTGQTTFNNIWASMLGYDLNEHEPVSINTWRSLCHPDDLKKSDELIEKHIKGELPFYEFTARVKHKNGKYIWVLDKGKIIKRDKDGKPLLMFGIHINVTRHKELEDKLRKYLYFLNRAQEVTRTGCWSLDIKTGKLWWSKETFNIFNIPYKDEINFEEFLNSVHPDDREFLINAWNKALSGEKYNIVHRIIAGDKVKYVNETGEVSFDENNNPVEGFGTMQDITEKRMLEEKIEKENILINKVIELLPGFFWIVDNNKNITKINKNTRERFDCDIGEKCFIGIWNGKYLPEEQRKIIEETGEIPSDSKCHFCMANIALEKQEPVITELEDEGTFYKVWRVPINDTEYIHYLMDITEEKLREKTLYELSVTDNLTRIYNRRYISDRIQNEIDLCKRANRTFSLIMYDIDNFKNINDTYGHDVGDKVLIEVAKIVKNRIRKADVFARWGGEEFLILLPETRLLSAAYLAEELRKKIENASIINLKVTASFGVTEFQSEDDLQTIVKRADDLMYQAKKKGKNKVETEIKI